MPKSHMPAIGMLYNLKPFRGLDPKPEKPELLSCNDHGGVDLYYKDDDSGRQKWDFIPLGGDVYNIVVFATMNKGKKYLSCVNGGDDNGRVDMNHEDDGSGRQKWHLIPHDNGSFHIQIAGGMNPDKKFLSCTPNGSRVDLHHVDDNSGRQQWILIPEELQDTKVTRGDEEIVGSSDPFHEERWGKNDNSTEMEQTIKFERKVITTTSYQHESGHAFELWAELGGKIGPVEAKGGAKYSYETKNTSGHENSKEETHSFECKVKVAPHRSVKVELRGDKKNVRYPYTVTGESKLTGRKVRGNGYLIEQSVGSITYSATEYTLDGKEPIKEIPAVPTK